MGLATAGYLDWSSAANTWQKYHESIFLKERKKISDFFFCLVVPCGSTPTVTLLYEQLLYFPHLRQYNHFWMDSMKDGDDEQNITNRSKWLKLKVYVHHQDKLSRNIFQMAKWLFFCLLYVNVGFLSLFLNQLHFFPYVLLFLSHFKSSCCHFTLMNYYITAVVTIITES